MRSRRPTIALFILTDLQQSCLLKLVVARQMFSSTKTYHELYTPHLCDCLPNVWMDHNLLQNLQTPNLALHIICL